MKKLLLLLALMCVPILSAQQPRTNVITNSMTAAATTCRPATCTQFTFLGTLAGMSAQLSNTFVGTIQFEATTRDDDTGWASIAGSPVGGGALATSATATGIWQFNVVGIFGLRARVSAYTSGTIDAVITATPGFAPTMTTSSAIASLPSITYNATQPTLTDGQTESDVQITPRGAVIVNPGIEPFEIAGTNPTTGATQQLNIAQGMLIVTTDNSTKANVYRLLLPCNALRRANCQ